MRLLFACVFFISKIAFGSECYMTYMGADRGADMDEGPCPKIVLAAIPPNADNNVVNLYSIYHARLALISEEHDVFSEEYAMYKQLLELVFVRLLRQAGPLRP